MRELKFGWHMHSFPVDGSSGPQFIDQIHQTLQRIHPHVGVTLSRSYRTVALDEMLRVPVASSANAGKTKDNKLTFDAIPNLALSGKVLRIKGFGENRQGDIVYKVVVQPDTAAAQLRWNMTSTISISGR